MNKTHDTAPSPERLGEKEEAEVRRAWSPVTAAPLNEYGTLVVRLLATLDAERASRPSAGEAALAAWATAYDALMEPSAESMIGSRAEAYGAASARLRIALATPVPADDREPLDVERLARALGTGDPNWRGYLVEARRVAAEYSRLTGDKP